MKLKLHLLLLALCGAMMLTSCSSDDDDPTTVSSAVQTALDTMYPSAENVEWGTRSGYYVAECTHNKLEIEVWFTSTAEWCMTETDYGKNLSLLPSAVQTAFNSSEYATWTIDDIDYFEFSGTAFYVIEVESKGQADRNLYFYADGTLFKDVADTDDDDVIYPNSSISSSTSALQTALLEMYPTATKIEWEIEAGYYVAECMYNSREIEVWFTSTAEWCMTETDYGKNLSLLPSAVQTAFNSSAYTTWTIDDIDYYERTDIAFYLIEVETNGQTDRKLYYYADGTLIKDVADTNNDDIYPTTTIVP